MTRHPILALAAAAASSFSANMTRASGPTEWSQLDRDVEATCLTTAGLTDSTVSSSAVHFSDSFGMDARLVAGRYPRAHMHGGHGTLLCLYDRRVRHAEVQEVAPAVASSPLHACYDHSANRIAVGECLDRKLSEASAELSTEVSVVIKQMRELDGATGRALASTAFERSQRAFSAFREANCGWQAAQMSSGTGSGDVARECMIRMTHDRTAELNASLRRPARMTYRQQPPGA